MPKVTDIYIEEKKNQILDAALAVFMRKPLFAVNMQDIINETTFSQGAIYRYYQDIDDILIAVLNRFYQTIDFRQDVESLFNKHEKPEYILKNLFTCLSTYMSTALSGYCKISLELNMLYLAYPGRATKFRNSLTEQNSYDFILDKCFQFITSQIKSGYFTPIIPIDDIISFAVASYDGIMKNFIMSTHYSLEDNLPSHTKYNAQSLIKTLCETVLYLLGSTLKKSDILD